MPPHPTQIFCAAPHESPGWIADKRELVGRIDAVLSDIRQDFDQLLDPGDDTASQAFARDERDRGANGIVHPSVLNPGGMCFAAFYPDVMAAPVQGRHITYHWDGVRIDMFKDLTDGSVYAVSA